MWTYRIFLIQKIRGLNQKNFQVSSSSKILGVYEYFRKQKKFNTLEVKALCPTAFLYYHFLLCHLICQVLC